MVARIVMVIALLNLTFLFSELAFNVVSALLPLN
jgi:hypothetical protein